MSLVLSACEPQAPGTDLGVVVPSGLLASDDARARGEKIFAEKCALCHGTRGDGRGMRKLGLSGPPANFRSARWRADATPGEVFTVLERGVRGTSMPAWPALSDNEKWDVVSYVLGLSEERP
ncbi:MAG: cytochrome c [Myxococcota bacterium]